MFFFVIYRKRLIDGIFAAASCCICFSPFLDIPSGRSKLGFFSNFLISLISMLNLALSLFILLIIIMVEVWGKERVKGVKITEEGAAVQPLAQEPCGTVEAPHGRSMLDAAHCDCIYSSPPINLKLCTFFNLGRMNLPRISDTSISKSWICISLMWTSRSTSYLVLSASTHLV